MAGAGHPTTTGAHISCFALARVVVVKLPAELVSAPSVVARALAFPVFGISQVLSAPGELFKHYEHFQTP